MWSSSSCREVSRKYRISRAKCFLPLTLYDQESLRIMARSAPEAVFSAPTPEPATLGLLAMGAPGLSIWRREDAVGERFQAN